MSNGRILNYAIIPLNTLECYYKGVSFCLAKDLRLRGEIGLRRRLRREMVVVEWVGVCFELGLSELSGAMA